MCMGEVPLYTLNPTPPNRRCHTEEFLGGQEFRGQSGGCDELRGAEECLTCQEFWEFGGLRLLRGGRDGTRGEAVYLRVQGAAVLDKRVMQFWSKGICSSSQKGPAVLARAAIKRGTQ